MAIKMIQASEEIMKSLIQGQVLTGIEAIELYDLDDVDGASKVEIATDTLIDTFSLTQDDSEITEFKNELGAILHENETKMPYKATLSLANWKDEHLDYFNIKRVMRGSGSNKEVGVKFINRPKHVAKRMVLRMSSSNIYFEFPEMAIRSKATGEALRNTTFNAILNFTAKEDEDGSPMYMWEKSTIDVTTTTPTTISATGATFEGSVVAPEGTTLTKRGFAYANHTNPVVGDNKAEATGTGLGSFTKAATMLTASTKYWVRSYVVLDGETIYGNNVEFETTAV